ncbi:MAG: Holliday junction resolvase RuvX [SAR86 cluster bacterium]|jgi:putative Holliday junction resolvase|nr:Holliday junction resolvase RuvX [SAR86 cluster bacterium]MDA9140656.1 Holliday junction resolvase RuvX [Gammaproteobacteria bacterium]MBL6701942.1 Holliday junction resolvase RuvX [SAR86 cluster bacterium]MBL6822931.1 Holliday junction resolvase RuvX [SAR86 cluster bacterium]MDC0905740.1 Holliday junction resolvase RuvX [Gammaproteobacteria bacterium]
MQILAFDFGTQHIGVAVGQTITKTSSPLMILNVAREGKEIWNTISNLIDEWKPDRLLVGKPLNMDGTPSDMMKKVDPFFQKLQKISNIPCELVDERLTSFEAKQLMQTDSKYDRIDDLAAKIFLDNWIEHHVNSN